MKTKIMKSTIIVVILGIALWSCKKDTPPTPTSEINLNELQVDIFKHTFTFNKSDISSESAILELQIFSDAILNEIEDYKNENEFENAGISLNFEFNSNGKLVAYLDETRADGFYEVIDNLSVPEEWTDKLKCRSKDCVGQFISDMIEKYDGCAIFKIDKGMFGAMCYAQPC